MAGKFSRGVAYTLAASAVNLLVNVALVTLLPIALTVEAYGYLQLYMLYAGYSGLLHLGLIDGVYLRLGGEAFRRLDRSMLTGQFYILILGQSVAGGGIALAAFTLSVSSERSLVLWCLGIVVFVTNVRFFFLYILQATARFKISSLSILVDRISLVCGVLALYALECLTLQSVLILDVFCKSLGGIVAWVGCRHAFTLSAPLDRFRGVWVQTTKDIGAGSQLLLANMASLLVIGIFRLAIEYRWSIEVFAVVSLALGIAGMFSMFFGAVAVVLFPYLRRVSPSGLGRIHGALSELLSLLSGVALLSVVPLWWFVENWLPEYGDVVRYLAVLMPILVFDGRVTLLSNSFLKTVRAERVMLKMNVLTVIFSVGWALLFTVVSPSLMAALVGVLLSTFIRASLAELYLRRYVQVEQGPALAGEIAVTVTFIGSGLLSAAIAPSLFMCYVVFLILWTVWRRKVLSAAVQTLRGVKAGGLGAP